MSRHKKGESWDMRRVSRQEVYIKEHQGTVLKSEILCGTCCFNCPDQYRNRKECKLYYSHDKLKKDLQKKG